MKLGFSGRGWRGEKNEGDGASIKRSYLVKEKGNDEQSGK
jgi:hypothetical protein